MVVTRPKKCRKQRGSRECGWGNKHRNTGRKGGAGHSGTGKRAKSKMPQAGCWTIQRFGKHGFKFKGVSADVYSINLIDIEAKIDSWIAEKKVVNESGVFVVDLLKLGFTKLLGDGRVARKLRINVPFASKTAVEKVKSAGGEVIGLEKA